MAEASVDIGGIAKGFAVDRAAEAMEAVGVMGGLVQCGGDLRVFGLTERCEPWTISLQGPHDESQNTRAEVLELTVGAVSTSGDFRRYFTIQERRRSHIVDPRSGRSVVDVPQVTVVAPNAVVSDGWSTALSVLGPDGLTLLPTGVEARIWVRSGTDLRVISTPGFGQHPRRL
jgi:thiamine biosynthesis lipoprotein